MTTKSLLILEVAFLINIIYVISNKQCIKQNK
jgi:uncharacterized protein YoxC